MRRALIALSILAAACSSTPRQPAPGRPAVGVVQRGMIFFGSGTTTPLSMEVTVANAAQEPVTIHRVRLDPGAGMGQYSTYPAERIINKTLQPGESTNVGLMVTAYTNVSRLTPSEPLSIRATIDYQFQGQRHRELYLFRDVRE